jgi:hypothetical protein
MIEINYYFGLRIPYHHMSIKMEYNHSEERYEMEVKTEPMQGETGFEYSRTDNIFIIDKNYFESIYNKISKIDYKDILIKNVDFDGLDGYSVDLKFGGFMNNLTVSLWSPSYNESERGLKELNDIIKELFIMAGLIEFYND